VYSALGRLMMFTAMDCAKLSPDPAVAELPQTSGRETMRSMQTPSVAPVGTTHVLPVEHDDDAVHVTVDDNDSGTLRAVCPPVESMTLLPKFVDK
jgi:hypothetical protein